MSAGYSLKQRGLIRGEADENINGDCYSLQRNVKCYFLCFPIDIGCDLRGSLNASWLKYKNWKKAKYRQI